MAASGFTVSTRVHLNLAAVQNELSEHGGTVGRFGQTLAGRITRRAKELAPYDTGTLADSLATRTAKKGGELSWEITGVYYLEYVTNGNPGEPNSFIEDAAYAVAAEFF